MKWSFATALALVLAGGVVAAIVMGPRPALAQGAVQCADFAKLRDDAQQKALAFSEANKRKADRKEACALITTFTTAESKVVKFMTDNKTWCGVPDQVITQAKLSHEKAMKFRTMVCAEPPAPKQPTLSDAIGTPSVGSDKIKTGRGTFDTLTGTPLGR